MPAAPTILVLIESDYYEHEIWYYQFRFKEAGVDARFVSRLWDQPRIVFNGHEHQAPFECADSFEAIDDSALDQIAAVIVPSGYVADRLRFTEDLGRLPPATAFLARATGGLHLHSRYRILTIVNRTNRSVYRICPAGD